RSPRSLPTWAPRDGGGPRAALTPVPLSRASPTHPPRTGEGRHHPKQEKEKLSCFWEGAPSPARGGGRLARAGEGRGEGPAARAQTQLTGGKWRRILSRTELMSVSTS